MKVPFTWKPTGWFMVAWSGEIPPGTVKPLQYFGGHQVAYRTDGRGAPPLDAHCPHLGAHLGHGGKVQGESIVCPFHAWRYDADGVCASRFPTPKNPAARTGGLLAPGRKERSVITVARPGRRAHPGGRCRTCSRPSSTCPSDPSRVLPAVPGDVGQVRA